MLSQGMGAANVRLRLSKPVNLDHLLSSVDQVLSAPVATTIAGSHGGG